MPPDDHWEAGALITKLTVNIDSVGYILALPPSDLATLLSRTSLANGKVVPSLDLGIAIIGNRNTDGLGPRPEVLVRPNDSEVDLGGEIVGFGNGHHTPIPGRHAVGRPVP